MAFLGLSTDGAGTPSFTWNGDTDTGFYWAAAGVIGLTINGLEAVRFSGPYIRMAAGSTGIQFGGRTGAANALDDYEEGTWLPIIADAATGGANTKGTHSGTYVKIAKIVVATFSATNLQTQGMTAGNQIYIRGLPYSAENITPDFVAPVHLSGLTGGLYSSNTAVLKTTNSAAYLRISTSTTAAAQSFMPVSYLANTTADIFGTITYFTST